MSGASAIGGCLAAAALLLPGCASAPAPDDRDADAPAAAPATAAAAPPAARRGAPSDHPDVSGRVLVPRGAAWLADRLDAGYRRMPATLALRQIAGGRPVSLVFEPSVDPLVSAPDGAATVLDHLAAICSQADWSWSVGPGGVVLVGDLETRTFRLASQPGDSTAELRQRALGAGAGGTPAGGAAVRVELSPYAEEVERMVRGVLGLSGGGARQGGAAEAVDPRIGVTSEPSANQVTVTARPHQMRRVERRIARLNAASAAAVRIDVTVYEVAESTDIERSLDLDALRAAAVSVGAVVEAAPVPGGGSLTLTFGGGGSADGSEAVLRWLRRAGRTSIAFRDSIEVRNNQVASIDATQTRRVVSRVSRERTTQGPAQSETPSVEFGELRTGWAISVQPTIADGGEVTLRLGVSRSSLVREEPYSFDEGRIAGTNHVTDDLHRLMSLTMRDGETRLVTSLSSGERRQESSRRPWLPWLGDARSRRGRDREVVMLLAVEVL